jgi:hypothetical protein
VTTFRNVYEDAERAEAYSRLEFPGTYFLAYRDLPDILSRHVAGRRAVEQPDKVAHFRDLERLLAPEGRVVSLVSTPEIYTHEWASFSTRDFPENRDAKGGDVVRIVMTDVADRRPVEDVVCSKASYREIYREAGLELVASYEPLGRDGEPFGWVNETRVAPWRIDVLKRA